MGKLNVAIADDNEVMRDLLEEMVTSDDELHLIGMAKDGEEACHLIKEKEPEPCALPYTVQPGVLDKNTWKSHGYYLLRVHKSVSGKPG